MFDSVEAKLEAAGCFIDLLKSLERESGGTLASASPRIVTALLDAFLFEVIAAKDFFLQEVNDALGLDLSRKSVSEQELVRNPQLSIEARAQVKDLLRLSSDTNSWLWRLNNYRNAAAHRNIIRKKLVAVMGTDGVRLFLDADPYDPSSEPSDKEIIPYCEGSLGQMRGYLQKMHSQSGF